MNRFNSIFFFITCFVLFLINALPVSFIPKIILSGIDLACFVILFILFHRISAELNRSRNACKSANNKLLSLEKELDEYKEFSIDSLKSVSKIIYGIGNLFYNNRIDDNDWGEFVKNGYSIDKIKTEYNELLQKFNLEDYSNLFKKMKSMAFFVEVFYKIPYLIEFLNKVTEKTEKAATVLLEKFVSVMQENSDANLEAQKNLKFFQKNEGENSFDAIMSDAKNAVVSYTAQVEEIVDCNRNNLESLNKMNEKIQEVSRALSGIVEISEKNKVIYLNLSIQAVNLGDKGKSIKVIVSEIQKLNEQTRNIILQIDDVMKSLKEYSEILIQEWNSKSMKIVQNIDMNAKKSEAVIQLLIKSYESTSRLFIKLSDSTSRVNENMNRILESLQFQDITRQQIENVIWFLQDIRNSYLNEKDFLKYFHIDLDEEKSEIKEKIRNDFKKHIKVAEEKKVIEYV